MDPWILVDVIKWKVWESQDFFLCFLYPVHLGQSPAIIWKKMLVLRLKLGQMPNTLPSGSVLNHL